jgi:hypothetical protein
MINKFLSVIILLTAATSCQKSSSVNQSNNGNNTNNGTSATEITKPQYNNTSFGVYKGVVIGSSGTIFFRINNGDNTAKGYLNIDNKWDTLSTTNTIVTGQPLINVVFTGRFSSMTLNANADGSQANLTAINITGHINPTIFIMHENSTKQIYCYEGTFNGSNSGTLNCARVGQNNGDTAYVLTRITGDTSLSNGFGQVNNNSATINLYRDLAITFVVQGNFSGNNFSGTWSWAAIGNGTFACTRTY